MSSIRPDRPQLITLGRLALLDGEGAHLVSPDSGKLLALLAYLAAAPGRRVTRDQLIDLFWADSPLAKARNALRQLIYKLRETLGDELIPHGSGIDICLGPSLATDRDAFLAALNANDLETAIELYGGPYAPGIVSAGSAGFEQWADREREGLHDRFVGAAESLAQHALASGHHQRAQQLAQRLINHDKCNEQAWRLRLQAELAGGSRVHIAATVAELRRLAADMGRELDPRTQRLIDAINFKEEVDHRDVGATPIVADLVGREKEFASLYGAWHHVVGSRRGAHLHLVAGAGLGKTRCLSDLAMRLRTERARLVSVRTTPRQRLLPDSFLAALVTALVDLPGAGGVSPRSIQCLVDLQPAVASRYGNPTPLVTVDAVARRLARTEALHDLLSALADEAPLALLLDDAHWWDSSSHEIVADLIEGSAHRPLLFVTASRPGAGEISTALTTEVITLKPLSTGEITDLVLSLGESDQMDAVQRLATALLPATNGVPLHLLEALRLGLDRDQLFLSDGTWGFEQLEPYLHSLQPGAMLAERIAALSPSRRETLLLVALLEQPVDVDTMERAGADDAQASLSELEHLGKLTVRGGRWVVAHDAIAQAVCDAASPDQRRTAHARLGTMLLAESTSDLTLVEALRHLIDAEDWPAINRAAVQYLTATDAKADQRGAAVVLHELLDGVVEGPAITRIIAALPARLRRRKYSLRIAGPAWLVVGAMLMGVAWWKSVPAVTPDATLGLFAGPGARPLVVTVRTAGWARARGELETFPDEQVTKAFPDSVRALAHSPLVSPNGAHWLIPVRDSTNLQPTELMLGDGTGRYSHIAPAPGDDVSPDWSPDSRHAVFATTRWSREGDASFSLAIVDVPSGAVRRLTQGPYADQVPHWSPDGTRIAFLREHEARRPDEACWITIDGAREECIAALPNVGGIVGWLDSESLLLAGGQSLTETGLWILELPTGRLTSLLTKGLGEAILSPDAFWLACNCRFPEDAMRREARLYIFPTRQPELRRPVSNETDAILRSFYWQLGRSRPFIRGVRIAQISGSLPVGGSYRATASGIVSLGTNVALSAATLSWRSSESRVLRVDSITGDLRAVRTGTAWLFASAGGWRTDSLLVHVADSLPGNTVAPLQTESWNSNWPQRWKAFGLGPPPAVVADSLLGSSWTPNGDGRYDNGVVSVAGIPEHDGLGFEATIRAPITRRKWQRLRISLEAVEQQTPSGPTGPGCSAQYPSGEGWHALRYASGTSGAFEVPESLTTGRPFRLRVQLFPDGSCGVAIDGRALIRSVERMPTDRDFSIILRGQSVATRMLVGTVRMWHGVREDVDWAALNRDASPEKVAVKQ